MTLQRDHENGLWRAAELQSELDEALAENAKLRERVAGDESKIDGLVDAIGLLRQEVEGYLRRITSMTGDLGDAMREAARLRGENEMLREKLEEERLEE